MIELTKEQIELIERQLNGEFNPFLATVEEKEVYMEMIDKAEALMDEMDAYDKAGNDLVKWFYDQYKAQENQK